MTGAIKQGLGTFIGNAGEHYVMAELLKRRIVAGLAPRNTPGVDVLASKGIETVRIRVKTKTVRAKEWRWNVKVPKGIQDKWQAYSAGLLKQEKLAECFPEAIALTPFTDVSETADFCVLVAIGEGIEYYILPTTQVERILQRGFECWVTTPGAKGQQRSVANKDRRMGPEYVAEAKANWNTLWFPE